MAGNTYDLRLTQGATYHRGARAIDSNGAPIPLTGGIIRAQIRRNFGDAVPLVSLTCAIDDPLEGHFTFGLTSAQVAALTATGPAPGQKQSYVWDLFIEIDGIVVQELSGAVYVKPRATTW